MNVEVAVPWSPAFFELGGEYVAVDRNKGQRSWYVRGQNFATVVSWAADGEVLREPAAPDEHAILVPASTTVEVTTDRGERATATGPAFVVAPAGQAEVTIRRAGYVVRVFSARSEVAARATNQSTYTRANSRVAALPPAPVAGPGTLRVVSLTDIAEAPGQAYRTDSLMINWRAPQDGPHDTDALSPQSHEDFELMSIALAGEHVHHVRRPWTTRMRDWRPDEHVQITSPSVTLIPPGNVHTTRAVGRGTHQLIDVFAPPRADFIERGWVLNQSDYEFDRREPR